MPIRQRNSKFANTRPPKYPKKPRPALTNGTPNSSGNGQRYTGYPKLTLPPPQAYFINTKDGKLLHSHTPFLKVPNSDDDNQDIDQSDTQEAYHGSLDMEVYNGNTYGYNTCKWNSKKK